MLEYYKQEMRDLRDPESGKIREVYKVLFDHSLDGEGFMNYMSKHSILSAGATQMACVTIADLLGELLAVHGSVTLPGIGTFSVGIRAKKGKEKGLKEKGVSMSATGQPLEGAKEELKADADTNNESHDLNARSLEVNRINFKCSRELMKDVSGRLRGKGSFQQSRYFGYVPLYTPSIPSRQQRFAAAREFLQTHPFLRVADYATLTGLSYSTAQRELKLASTLTHSGLVATGRGNHRLYVLRKNED